MVIIIAVVYFPLLLCSLSLSSVLGGDGNSSYKPTKHAEVYRAKNQIDSLLFKLSLDLNALKAKEALADEMKVESKRLKETAEKEVLILKYIQHLLDQFSKGALDHRSLKYCGASHVSSLRIHTSGSALPKNYTVSIQVNHRELIDRKVALENGNDLRVYYNGVEGKEEPKQIDRVISGLGTKAATVHFRLQAPIKSNSFNNVSYFLVFGGQSSGPAMRNPEKVFAFYDDFTDNKLKSDWKVNWGEWTVQNGRLRGKMGRTPTGDHAEIGVYVASGTSWKDVEVELDMMDDSPGKSYPGPFLRVQDANVRTTTAWWMEYSQGETRCTMRPFQNNKDGSWVYKANLPTPLNKNVWFHFKYRVLEDKFSQWANEKHTQDNVQVSKQWMVPSGTVGLGCHNLYSGSPRGCQVFFDNIKVTLLVPSPPTVTLGDIHPLWSQEKAAQPLGQKNFPAHSCKQVHDASLQGDKPQVKNGLYWIKTDLHGKHAVQTYCDIENGGWTLVGKINGKVGNIYDTWLVKDHNSAALKSPKISSSTEYACLDARTLAVEYASVVLFSSGESEQGLGSKWVKWPLPENRERGTFWKHAIGQSVVNAAPKTPVMVSAWNGQHKTCYQNKYGIMPIQGHGGSYPSASYNTNGNTARNDLCMSVGVLTTSASAHGWSQNGNGYDSPKSDSDWPNRSYNHQRPRLSVWLK